MNFYFFEKKLVIYFTIFIKIIFIELHSFALLFVVLEISNTWTYLAIF